MTKKLGLALGGGAMRGLAHIGVLQVLEENHIPIDYIAGTSIGAVVGGIYACGTDLDMLAKVIPTLVFKDYIDKVLPLNGGFLRGEKFRELIELFTKRYTFEQIKMPLSCVSVDLVSGNLVELTEGSISQAIRASMSIPGVFEPVKMDDMILVDGGVIARVPSQTVRDMGADFVLGVDVGYRGSAMVEPSTKWLSCVLRSTDILGWVAAQAQEKDANIMLTPDVGMCDPMSFDDYEACIEAGRVAATQALPKIRRALSIPSPNAKQKKATA